LKLQELVPLLDRPSIKSAWPFGILVSDVHQVMYRSYIDDWPIDVGVSNHTNNLNNNLNNKPRMAVSTPKGQERGWHDQQVIADTTRHTHTTIIRPIVDQYSTYQLPDRSINQATDCLLCSRMLEEQPQLCQHLQQPAAWQHDQILVA
jgi:hypothetical protein